MTTVLVTGPESSGTSLVSRILRSAGATVYHRSATYDVEYPDMRGLAKDHCNAVVVVFRDPFCTMKSQDWTGRSFDKLQEGYHEIFYALMDLPKPIYAIPYESLVLTRGRCVIPLLRTLGLDDSVEIEPVHNANSKWWR